MLDFITANEGCTQSDMVDKLEMSKKTVGHLLRRAKSDGRITESGKGIKGDQLRYALYRMQTLSAVN
jgi:hypothetical protein